MPKLPVVAIIGRPNTGKSTLFNRLIGKRRAIESPVPGTTRDRISQLVRGEKISYLLLDTGGIGTTEDKDFEKDVAGQSQIALEQADLILLTVNAREPATSDDLTVLNLLRRKRKRNVPVIVVLTKADNEDLEQTALADYQEFNIGSSYLAVSASHALGLEDLREAIEDELLDTHEPTATTEAPAEGAAPRIAIIGRPNVGKSSIVNALMTDSQRETAPLMVSSIAGTTRDSTDTEVTYHGRPFVLVDTAGLKRRPHAVADVERLSMMRTITSVEGSDIVVLVLDALLPVTQQDKKIAAMAVESGKGLIILVNKIDAVKGDARKAKMNEVGVLLSFCRFAKIIPVSAVTREGLVKIFDTVDAVQRSRTLRLTSRALRRWFDDTIHGQPLGELGRCKHLTQADEVPPTFVFFVKNPKHVKTSDLRYLERKLRETFGFDGVPIRMITKNSEKRESE